MRNILAIFIFLIVICSSVFAADSGCVSATYLGATPIESLNIDDVVFTFRLDNVPFNSVDFTSSQNPSGLQVWLFDQEVIVEKGAHFYNRDKRENQFLNPAMPYSMKYVDELDDDAKTFTQAISDCSGEAGYIAGLNQALAMLKDGRIKRFSVKFSDALGGFWKKIDSTKYIVGDEPTDSRYGTIYDPGTVSTGERLAEIHAGNHSSRFNNFLIREVRIDYDGWGNEFKFNFDGLRWQIEGKDAADYVKSVTNADDRDFLQIGISGGLAQVMSTYLGKEAYFKGLGAICGQINGRRNRVEEFLIIKSDGSEYDEDYYTPNYNWVPDDRNVLEDGSINITYTDIVNEAQYYGLTVDSTTQRQFMPIHLIQYQFSKGIGATGIGIGGVIGGGIGALGFFGGPLGFITTPVGAGVGGFIGSKLENWIKDPFVSFRFVGDNVVGAWTGEGSPTPNNEILKGVGYDGGAQAIIENLNAIVPECTIKSDSTFDAIKEFVLGGKCPEYIQVQQDALIESDPYIAAQINAYKAAVEASLNSNDPAKILPNYDSFEPAIPNPVIKLPVDNGKWVYVKELRRVMKKKVPVETRAVTASPLPIKSIKLNCKSWNSFFSKKEYFFRFDNTIPSPVGGKWQYSVDGINWFIVDDAALDNAFLKILGEQTLNTLLQSDYTRGVKYLLGAFVNNPSDNCTATISQSDAYGRMQAPIEIKKGEFSETEGDGKKYDFRDNRIYSYLKDYSILFGFKDLDSKVIDIGEGERPLKELVSRVEIRFKLSDDPNTVSPTVYFDLDSNAGVVMPVLTNKTYFVEIDLFEKKSDSKLIPLDGINPIASSEVKIVNASESPLDSSKIYDINLADFVYSIELNIKKAAQQRTGYIILDLNKQKIIDANYDYDSYVALCHELYAGDKLVASSGACSSTGTVAKILFAKVTNPSNSNEHWLKVFNGVYANNKEDTVFKQVVATEQTRLEGNIRIKLPEEQLKVGVCKNASSYDFNKDVCIN